MLMQIKKCNSITGFPTTIFPKEWFFSFTRIASKSSPLARGTPGHLWERGGAHQGHLRGPCGGGGVKTLFNRSYDCAIHAVPGANHGVWGG